MFGDTFWINLRYLMIAGGVSLLVSASKGTISEEHALPLVEWLVGFVLSGGAWFWGNYVRKGTKAVPMETAKRADVPTVSAATGKIDS